MGKKMILLAGIILLATGVLGLLYALMGDWVALFGPLANYSIIQWPILILAAGEAGAGVLLLVAGIQSD
ncbi:MAG: hypothetical protein HWN65_14155 [Candidatus Helarchaeota archaeon]|nr:hypothetical protein [Candidatus Helarchaeota archaeon]